MSTKLYPEQDHPALGDLYTRHVEAMTAEGLHAKSAIAAQLAWRDAEIARLQAQLAEARALSVKHILLAVVPGEDGMGEEVYAQSVADVERLLSELAERAEEADSLEVQLAAQQALVVELADALHAMMDGSVHKSIAGDEPDWHVIAMPRRPALEKARAALAKVGR